MIQNLLEAEFGTLPRPHDLEEQSLPVSISEPQEHAAADVQKLLQPEKLNALESQVLNLRLREMGPFLIDIDPELEQGVFIVDVQPHSQEFPEGRICTNIDGVLTDTRANASKKIASIRISLASGQELTPEFAGKVSKEIGDQYDLFLREQGYSPENHKELFFNLEDPRNMMEVFFEFGVKNLFIATGLPEIVKNVFRNPALWSRMKDKIYSENLPTSFNQVDISSYENAREQLEAIRHKIDQEEEPSVKETLQDEFNSLIIKSALGIWSVLISRNYLEFDTGTYAMFSSDMSKKSNAQRYVNCMGYALLLQMLCYAMLDIKAHSFITNNHVFSGVPLMGEDGRTLCLDSNYDQQAVVDIRDQEQLRAHFSRQLPPDVSFTYVCKEDTRREHTAGITMHQHREIEDPGVEESALMQAVKESIHPGSADEAGEFYEKIQNYDEAIKWYEIAKERDPENAIRWVRLARVYAKAGKFQDAEEHFLHAILANRTQRWRAVEYEYGMYLRAQGREAEALLHFQLALQENELIPMRGKVEDEYRQALEK